jgi:hypothetical protein
MFKEESFQVSEQPGSIVNAFQYSIIHILTTMKFNTIQAQKSRTQKVFQQKFPVTKIGGTIKHLFYIN